MIKLKVPLLLILIFPVTLFLNNKDNIFLIDIYWNLAQSVIFTIALTIILIWPRFRKAIFWLALILIIAMAFLYIINLTLLADMIGSTGVGFLMINLVSYLSQLVKKGYIEKI